MPNYLNRLPFIKLRTHVHELKWRAANRQLLHERIRAAQLWRDPANHVTAEQIPVINARIIRKLMDKGVDILQEIHGKPADTKPKRGDWVKYDGKDGWVSWIVYDGGSIDTVEVEFTKPKKQSLQLPGDCFSSYTSKGGRTIWHIE